METSGCKKRSILVEERSTPPVNLLYCSLTTNTSQTTNSLFHLPPILFPPNPIQIILCLVALVGGVACHEMDKHVAQVLLGMFSMVLAWPLPWGIGRPPNLRVSCWRSVVSNHCQGLPCTSGPWVGVTACGSLHHRNSLPLPPLVPRVGCCLRSSA